MESKGQVQLGAFSALLLQSQLVGMDVCRLATEHGVFCSVDASNLEWQCTWYVLSADGGSDCEHAVCSWRAFLFQQSDALTA